MRVLFVVPPLSGHVNPTIDLGAALADRGHTVAWAGHPSRVQPRLPPDATLLALPEHITNAAFADTQARSDQLRGFAALQFLWRDFFVPLAHAMVEPVREVVEAWQPDLLVVDQQTLAGAIVARQLGLPWATVVATSASLTGELDGLPKVAAWRDELLAQVQRDHGLDPRPHSDLSPHCVIVASTPALIGDTSTFPPQCAFVGPLLGGARPSVAFPWDRLDGRPLAIATMGTVNAERGSRFYRSVVEGLSDGDLQLVIGGPPALVGPVPDDVIVQGFLPLLDLYDRAGVVICHGGHNTVCEAILHGVPLVITPVKDDQPVVARQVERAGCGVRLKLSRLNARKIADGVAKVRTDATHAALARVAQSFRGAGGPHTGAKLLEALVPEAT